MPTDETERKYIEAKRRLDMASGRLTSLDGQIVDIAGAMATWRSSWRRNHDPETALTRIIGQPWPDQADIEAAVEEWLSAYHAATEDWARLSGEAQLRLNRPSQPERSALA